MKNTATSLIASLVLFCTLNAGCSSSTSTPSSQTYTGPAVSIGNGSAYTWVTVDASQKLTAAGVTITNSALGSLGNTDQSFELSMPTEVATQFKGVMLDYATHDEAPYNHPHIDPHFFLLDMNARMNIHADVDTMMPMNMQMPSGYMQDGDSAEEMMGTHWMDTTAAEMHGQPFVSTFTYGFTKGMMSFMELMCDKSSLDGQKSISGAVKTPTISMTSSFMALFPHNYSIVYNSSAKTTTIQLTDFK